jgi:hypothetical protein
MICAIARCASTHFSGAASKAAFQFHNAGIRRGQAYGSREAAQHALDDNRPYQARSTSRQ